MEIYKKKSKIFITLISIAVICNLVSGSVSYASEKPDATPPQPVVVSGENAVTVNPTPSTILAPQGLTNKEQAALRQQYRYEARNKNLLLSPYISGGGEAGPETVSTREQTEGEKLHRYFGAAVQMYRDKKLDEAIEILKYIVEKDPGDEYAKNYLDRVIKEKDLNKKQWERVSDSDARILKDKKIGDLLRDGTDYYKQKQFDEALLKFADVLALDPGNKQAKQYFDKLKEYYLKEAHIEGLVEKYESGNGETETALEKRDQTKDVTEQFLNKKEQEINSSAQNMLNKKEGKVSAAAGALLEYKERESAEAAGRLLDEREMESIVRNKKMASFMDQAELGLNVDDIIAQKREEERKADLYTLGPGDVIEISVRDHPELSGSVVIKLNGDVILPLVNDIVGVKGLTVEEAARKVEAAMERYVKDPYVSITIEQYKSKTFYVIDEVGCTPFPITRANITLRDALFIADWGDNRALGRVIVIKPNDLHPIIRKVDAFDIIYRGNTSNNIKIGNGDVIYVPLTMAAKTSKLIADTLRPFAAVRTARDEWSDLKWNSQQGWQQLGRIPRTSALQELYQDPNYSTNNSSSFSFGSLTLGNSSGSGF